MRSKILKIALGSVLLVGTLVTFSFSADLGINSGVRTEFGVGVEQTVACDSHISTSLTSQIDSRTGTYVIDSVSLRDLSLGLRNRTVKALLIGKDKSVLGKVLQFSVGSDGLTYTSTRSHVDTLEAFELGRGPKAETGTSTITFNNILGEESTPIQAADFARIAIETSGQGVCTYPRNSRALEVYIDAPNVQGSYIAEDFASASLTDNYNGITGHFVDCPTSSTVGTYSFSGNGCKILQRTESDGSWYPWGGATTTSSTPTTGGDDSLQSPSAGAFTAEGTTITFSVRKNYLGFWWSGASYGNEIKFYRGSTLVATMTGDDVYSALPNDSTSLTALNGSTTYTASAYRGHPINTASPRQPQEPYVYIHAFAVNGFNFDKISFTMDGNGFEWDNLTVANMSTTQLAPKRTLVLNSTYNFTG